MNLSNASDCQESEQPEVQQVSETAGDLTKKRLQNGLYNAAPTQVSAQFNQPVLARLQSGADLRSGPEQVRTRLWWMTLPCICCCVVGTGLLQSVESGIPLPGPGEAISRPEQRVIPYSATNNGATEKTPALPPMPDAISAPSRWSFPVLIKQQAEGSVNLKKQERKPSLFPERNKNRQKSGKPGHSGQAIPTP